MNITLDHGLPYITHIIPGDGFNYRWELFKHTPHEEGWVVLGWLDFPGDDVTCIESYEFGEDLQAALTKFAEVHQRNPDRPAIN